jgi:hypothetical protein
LIFLISRFCLHSKIWNHLRNPLHLKYFHL